MKNPRRPSRTSGGKKLHTLLTAEFHSADQAYELFLEFLPCQTYSAKFCSKLMDLARSAEGPWAVRRLAVLMLEHQILKLKSDDLVSFDWLLTQLELKQSGPSQVVANSVLAEGYSTRDLSGFVSEFRAKLARHDRVHRGIRGVRTSLAAIREFIELSRRDCKLSLARYLFTPEEVIAQILTQLQATYGVIDIDPSQPAYVDQESARTFELLPDFESRILSGLCAGSRTFWVSDSTSTEINSLVEYPLTTVVLVIKPPGSDAEFEIKRVGRRGEAPLSVVYARNGYTVPPSHRLDGGCMQWLLRFEANSASKLAFIYSTAHQAEAPMAGYVLRSTIFSVPTPQDEVQTLPYFTDPELFGKGFQEMRVAMAESCEAFKAEGYGSLPEFPGPLGLTAQFISHVTPAQAILSGTSSFRLDKLARYLSSGGADCYPNLHSVRDAKRFADEILEEVLGVYVPPRERYQSHEQYVIAALAVEENRTRANSIYLSLIEQIAKFWGTVLAVRGHSRGESFVGRNVGLKSF